MIPPPTEKDGEKPNERYKTIIAGDVTGIGGEGYYGYQENLFEKVSATLASHDRPVDGLTVHLHKGLFEDTLHLNGHNYPGATKAVAEYCAAHPDMKKLHPRRPPERATNLVIQRLAA